MAKIGDIFVATWGYDQTNADFFQVVKVTNKGVSVRHIKSKIQEQGSGTMTGYATPIKNAFDGEPKTKRLTSWDGEEAFQAGESMHLATKWNGNPVAISWYG